MAALEGRRLELWTRIATRVDELTKLLSGLDADGWRVRCDSEGWPVALVGCHVSLGLRRQARWIDLVVAGRRPHAFDWERTNALNALVARRVVDPQPTDVIRALTFGVDRWRRLLERTTDEDLGRIAFRYRDRDSSVEWVAGALAPRHIDDHLRSICAALVSCLP